MNIFDSYTCLRILAACCNDCDCVLTIEYSELNLAVCICLKLNLGVIAIDNRRNGDTRSSEVIKVKMLLAYAD